MTIQLAATQPVADKKSVTIVATGLANGVTVFDMGDGTQLVRTAAGGTASVVEHLYASPGAYQIAVYNGMDAAHLALAPVSTAVAWPARSLDIRYDEDQPPFAVEVRLADIPSNVVVVTWGDSSTETVEVPVGGALFLVHKYAAAGTYTITVNTGTAPNLSEASFPVAQPAVVASVAPPSSVAGSGNIQLTVTGTKFQPGAQVSFDGVLVATTYVSETSVKAWIVAPAAADPTVPVGVQNPGGAALSNLVDIAFTAP